jgi:hypothetical protein
MSNKRQIMSRDETAVQKHWQVKAAPSPVVQAEAFNPGSIVQQGLAQPEHLASSQVLQLQRSVGNRATNRLLSQSQRPIGSSQTTIRQTEGPQIQRFYESKKEDLDYPGVMSASTYQVADANDIILPKGMHEFYASQAKYSESAGLLANEESGVELQVHDVFDSQSGKGAPLLGLSIRPSQKDQDSPNTKEIKSKSEKNLSQHEHTASCFLFPGSCRMAARSFMSGNPMDKSAGLFKQGDKTVRTGKHAAEESDKEWAMRFPRDMRFTMHERLIELSDKSDQVDASSEVEGKLKTASEIERVIPETEGGPTFPTENDAILGALYRKLSPEKKELFDREVGINQFADPEVGWGYASIYDFDLLSGKKQKEIIESRNKTERRVQESDADARHMTTAHWAMLLMKSGDDRLTAETARNIEFSSLTPNHNWSFEMYGTKNRTFHDKWGGSSGAKTTMVTASLRGTGPTQLPSLAPAKKKGDPALANMELINQIKNIMQHWEPKPPWGDSPSAGQLRNAQSQIGLNEQAYIQSAEFGLWAQANAHIDARRYLDID